MKKTLFVIFASLSQCTPSPAGVVANTLFLECRGEPKAGQMAVASVIWNRSRKRNITQTAVCLARKQFSCWNEGVYTPEPANEAERAILAFFEGIERDMTAGTFRPTITADHYHALSVIPKWSKDMKQVWVIGNHKFGVCK